MSIYPALYSPADLTTGHDVFPPTGFLPPGKGCSPDVVINGSFVHRAGDTTILHVASSGLLPPPHTDTIRTGYPTVLVNVGRGGGPIASLALSVLTPDPPGIPAVSFMSGYNAVNVVCGAGNLNTPARISGVRV